MCISPEKTPKKPGNPAFWRMLSTFCNDYFKYLLIRSDYVDIIVIIFNHVDNDATYFSKIKILTVKKNNFLPFAQISNGHSPQMAVG